MKGDKEEEEEEEEEMVDVVGGDILDIVLECVDVTVLVSDDISVVLWLAGNDDSIPGETSMELDTTLPSDDGILAVGVTTLGVDTGRSKLVV